MANSIEPVPTTAGVRGVTETTGAGAITELHVGDAIARVPTVNRVGIAAITAAAAAKNLPKAIERNPRLTPATSTRAAATWTEIMLQKGRSIKIILRSNRSRGRKIFQRKIK